MLSTYSLRMRFQQQNIVKYSDSGDNGVGDGVDENYLSNCAWSWVRIVRNAALNIRHLSLLNFQYWFCLSKTIWHSCGILTPYALGFETDFFLSWCFLIWNQEHSFMAICLYSIRGLLVGSWLSNAFLVRVHFVDGKTSLIAGSYDTTMFDNLGS